MISISNINRLVAYCKGGTLIFIFGRGSAISSVKQGKSGAIYDLVTKNKLFGPRKRACIS